METQWSLKVKNCLLPRPCPSPSRPGTGLPISSFFHIYSGWYRGGLCISENVLLRQGQGHYTALCERNARGNFSSLWPAYSQKLRGDPDRVCRESWSHWSFRWAWGIGRQGASAKTHLVQELMPLISQTLPALPFMSVDDDFTLLLGAWKRTMRNLVCPCGFVNPSLLSMWPRQLLTHFHPCRLPRRPVYPAEVIPVHSVATKTERMQGLYSRLVRRACRVVRKSNASMTLWQI